MGDKNIIIALWSFQFAAEAFGKTKSHSNVDDYFWSTTASTILELRRNFYLTLTSEFGSTILMGLFLFHFVGYFVLLGCGTTVVVVQNK